MKTVYVILKVGGSGRSMRWGLGYSTEAEAEEKARELRGLAENALYEIKVEKRELFDAGAASGYPGRMVTIPEND
jgi:hypothetical protein